MWDGADVAILRILEAWVEADEGEEGTFEGRRHGYLGAVEGDLGGGGSAGVQQVGDVEGAGHEDGGEGLYRLKVVVCHHRVDNFGAVEIGGQGYGRDFDGGKWRGGWVEFRDGHALAHHARGREAAGEAAARNVDRAVRVPPDSALVVGGVERLQDVVRICFVRTGGEGGGYSAGCVAVRGFDVGSVDAFGRSVCGNGEDYGVGVLHDGVDRI